MEWLQWNTNQYGIQQGCTVKNWLSLTIARERSGSVVECLTQDRGAAGSSLTGVTALCPGARHISPSLVLVQPKKTHPYITENFLMGRKESNQTKKFIAIQNNNLKKITSTENIFY